MIKTANVLDNTPPHTLADLIHDLWKMRIYALFGGALGVIAAVLFLLLAIPTYQGYMTLSPANPMNGAESSSMMADNNLFALRFLLQRVGSGNTSDFIRFENKISGISVAKILIEDAQIKRGIQDDRSFIFSAAPEIKTPEALSEYVHEHVHITPVGATSIRKMTYHHASPQFARYFLQTLHQITDKQIRQNIHQESTKRITYLAQTITETTNPEHRRALTALLLEQERLRMLVSIEAPYAAAIVENPAVSSKAQWPSPTLTLLSFILCGALCGIITYNLRHLKNQTLTDQKLGSKQQSDPKTWINTNHRNMNYKDLIGPEMPENEIPENEIDKAEDYYAGTKRTAKKTD